MKVVVACEYSGRVRDAFIARGHDAISVDLLPTEAPGPHFRGDIKDFFTLNDPKSFDLMIAHPPCTHLAVSGRAWFKYKVKEQVEALEFVKYFFDLPIEKVCLENPVSVISTRIKKPTQVVEPNMFGHPYTKATCLWLKNLKPLVYTKLVHPKKGSFVQHNIHDKHLRSKTFKGLALAMAAQWG